MNKAISKVAEGGNLVSDDKWLQPIHTPQCPSCGNAEMIHKCHSPFPHESSFKNNGWYCQLCAAGPYLLNGVTEEECAQFASSLLNNECMR
ncbi:hypothetical protein DDO73_17545 [Vibrio cholerae]|nr:hypothetical protein [Vibrio cholerae]